MTFNQRDEDIVLFNYNDAADDLSSDNSDDDNEKKTARPSAAPAGQRPPFINDLAREMYDRDIKQIQMRRAANAETEGAGLDLRAKVILLGESGVGKTLFARQLGQSREAGTGGQTNLLAPSVATIGVDFQIFYYLVNEMDKVTVEVWDTAGQERFSPLPLTYTHRTNAIIAMFDSTQPATLTRMSERWLGVIDHCRTLNSDLVVVLVSNKIDLVNQRSVSTTVGWEFMRCQQFTAYFESTNKNTDVVHDAFEMAVKYAYIALRKSGADKRKELFLSRASRTPEKVKCCGASPT